MVVLLVGGFFGLRSLPQEVMPEVELDLISISAAYPGASPAQVERAVLIPLEEALVGIDGIVETTSSAEESLAQIGLELRRDANPDRVLADVKAAVDRTVGLPESLQRPLISLALTRRQVVALLLHGDIEALPLLRLAERIKRELEDRPDISYAEVRGLPPREISVEVDAATLRRLGTSTGELATRLAGRLPSTPAGALQRLGQDVLLRADQEPESSAALAQLPLLTSEVGTPVRLGTIADVRDSLLESDLAMALNGARAAQVSVYRTGDETPITISEAVAAYIETLDLPEGVRLTIWDDRTDAFRGRIDLLVNNAVLGLVLVLLALGLFLAPRLAFWVTVGIPVAFVGALIPLAMFGVSLNMISLFGFIVALGMVVDDAIIVGEAVQHARDRGARGLAAAMEGLREVAGPVTFSVLTTCIAFSPLLFIPGVSGKFFVFIPLVVIAVLLASLFECVCILPSHLAHIRESRGRGVVAAIARAQARFAAAIGGAMGRALLPVLRSCLSWRYLVMALALALLLGAFGLVRSGTPRFVFFPRVERDSVKAELATAVGTPQARTAQVAQSLVMAAQDAGREVAGEAFDADILVTYAEANRFRTDGSVQGGLRQGHLASIEVKLPLPEGRTYSAEAFAKAWRVKARSTAGLAAFAIDYATGLGGGRPIDVRLRHPDRATLERAAEALGQALERQPGVVDVDSGVAAGKGELNFRLKPGAEAAGLTLDTLGAQVRDAIQGAPARRLFLEGDEVPVVVRLAERDRLRAASLRELPIKLPNGELITLEQTADVLTTRAYTKIERREGRRELGVSADLQPDGPTPDEAIRALNAETLPQLRERFSGLDWRFGGDKRNQSMSLGALARGFGLALLAMYALLTLAFGSFLQPALVMVVIPFGFLGALAGHLLLGLDLSIMSLMGFIALSGVVVNDSLVFVSAVNTYRRTMQLEAAVIAAARRRFRPIMLTSITTFFGLTPMLLETSVQARFLIPMAVSLAFGVAGATVLTLLLLPALYLALEDLRRLWTTVFKAPPRAVDA